MELIISNLSKKYYSRKLGEIDAVKDVSFCVSDGQITGLLGPNGAGKTTIIKMICNLINPTSGSITFTEDDKSGDYNTGYISVVLEGNRNVYWRLTVRENLEFLSVIKGINPKDIQDRIDYYLNFFDLKKKEYVIAGKLSRGMQQKLSLAASMISMSKIVLLDEPTLGLDVKSAQDIRNKLKQLAQIENRIIIVSSHDMSFIQDTCNKVVIMNQGRKIVEDSVENLLNLFNFRKYKITLLGNLSELIISQLGDKSSLELVRDDLNTQLFISIENSKALYDVIETLREGNIEILSIASEIINFENVYLSILERDEQL